jgi:L-iditol 2-dehydrogenase
VLVIGSGISGLLHVQLAHVLGAERVVATDINEYRMNAAKKFGADAAIHASKYTPDLLKEANENRLADRVIICTGATSAFEQALRSVDRGGTILFFAPTAPDVKLPISVTDLWRNEITLMTSYGAGPPDIPPSIELIQAGKVNVHDMITHQLPLEEVGLGFKLAAEAKECIKVIIKP